jgi:protein involved in polysaccharide export with SLBB domain
MKQIAPFIALMVIFSTVRCIAAVPAAASASGAGYRIGAGDQLGVQVTGETAVSQKVVVADDGKHRITLGRNGARGRTNAIRGGG